MRVAAVILAAGASTRLGEPKQLVVVGEERLLERAVRVAGEAGCEPLVVVLGAAAERVWRECALAGTRVVVNTEWRDGISSSIKAGVAALDEGAVDGVVVMTCDQPAVNAGHIYRLCETKETTGSSYAGRRGIPAYFPTSAFGELSRLRGDAGARGLLAEAKAVALPGGDVDVDTAESLAAARAIYGQMPSEGPLR